MQAKKREKLATSDWIVGDTDQFLELSPAERAIVEIKLALGDKLREVRRARHLSQRALADEVNSSQSRIAKMEAGQASVTIDLLVRTLLNAGATKDEVAKAIDG